MEAIKRMFGIGPSVDYAQLIKEGAVILDVRSRGEYDGGHIRGSINISVNQLKENLHKLPGKEKIIITCCASGMRSSSAKNLLEASGYTKVYNGGGWMSLQNKI